MSLNVRCDAPGCNRAEPAYGDGAPIGWITLTLEDAMHHEPVRTLHACSATHAVTAIATAFGLADRIAAWAKLRP